MITCILRSSVWRFAQPDSADTSVTPVQYMKSNLGYEFLRKMSTGYLCNSTAQKSWKTNGCITTYDVERNYRDKTDGHSSQKDFHPVRITPQNIKRLSLLSRRHSTHQAVIRSVRRQEGLEHCADDVVLLAWYLGSALQYQERKT